MKRAALLLLTGALLSATPAHADFFKDLGDALGQLGDKIGETVDDALTQKPVQPAQQQPAQPQGQIIWNPPPARTDFSGATVYTPPMAMRPRDLPNRRRNAASGSAAMAEAANTPVGVSIGRNGVVDDAPPPRRAPRRTAVEASYIAPLPGFSEAPPRPAAAYSPVLAAASLADNQVANVAASRGLPAAKPASVQNRDFTVTFNGHRARISDAVLQNRNTPPAGDSKSLVDALATALKSNPQQRVKLQSQSVVLDDRQSEARKRSFDRALLVKSWLEAAGARPTQIDLEVTGAGVADRVALNIYTPN